jgi:hypothetical protein
VRPAKHVACALNKARAPNNACIFEPLWASVESLRDVQRGGLFNIACCHGVRL